MRSNLDIAKIVIIILGGYSLMWSITSVFLFVLQKITYFELIFLFLFGLLIGLWCIGFGAAVPFKNFIEEDTKKEVKAK